jgi:hypothetical protein
MPSSHVVLDQVDIAFDDQRSVASAGLLLRGGRWPSGWGSSRSPSRWSILATGWCGPPGRKPLTLVHAMVAGGDCTDDVELLRSGATGNVLGHQVMAAPTVGTFLRSFTFGHARQLDQVTATILGRAWAAGAGPGDGPLTIDVDSTICEVPATTSRAPATATPTGSATTHCWPSGPTGASCCMPGCARASGRAGVSCQPLPTTAPRRPVSE